MRRIDIFYLRIALLCTACLFYCAARSQNYKFRTFSAEQGLTHPYIYTISQDARGYLWIGTAEGLFTLDGMRAKPANAAFNPGDNFISSSFTDSKGNLWIGYNQGGAGFYDGKTIRSIATNGNVSSPITGITQDAQGNTWYTSQNHGLFRIGQDGKVKFFNGTFKRPVYSFEISPSGQLLIGTDEGVHVYSLPKNEGYPVFMYKVSGLPETKVQCIQKGGITGIFWAGTEDGGAYMLNCNTGKTCIAKKVVSSAISLEEENVQSILEDKESNLWLSTFGSGLYKLTRTANSLTYDEVTHFHEKNGLNSLFVKKVFQDREGNIWIGTYGAGLSVLQDNYFTFFSAEGSNESDILSVFNDTRSHWFGTSKGLMMIDALNNKTIFDKSHGLPEKITSVYRSADGWIWAGTEDKGVFRADSTMRFKKVKLGEDQLANAINYITGDNKNTWIATKAGLFRVSGNETVHYTTQEGLAHNNINHLFIDSRNDLWIATPGNFVTVMRSGSIVKYPVSYSGAMLNFVSVSQDDRSGDIWLATQGNGVLRFSEATKETKHYTGDNGLLSNYCYSIAPDGNGNIWIGHRTGLTRISSQKGTVKTFGSSDGINGDCNLNSIGRDNSGNLWVGTTKGIVRYNPLKDKKNPVPPMLNITSVRFSDKEYDPSAIEELPYDAYKLKIEFSGLTFREPERVKYQYLLEGHDEDWSELTSSSFALYNRIPEGDYIFRLRACNSDGVCTTEPLSFKFTVLSPLWKRWWFILLGACTSGYLLVVIVGVREKRMKDFQGQLKNMLDQRTKQVVTQKEELERKNKDITDSINYAKRIQEAILPDVAILNNVLPDSFIFYKPRDIVSGDFYWFNVKDDKLVIACADATGHGVPGALMSMIGSTLLKELYIRKEVDSPASMLGSLNVQLSNVLKKHEHSNAQESMDIIICEIDLLSHKVRMASAMRPAIIYTKGEQSIFKKRQQLLGTHESLNETFTDSEMQLYKGDSIYMFTDGYPDQFGGDNGKKLKTERFRQFIHTIHHLPMSEQKKLIAEHFDTWMNGHEQIDDVLVIGIRI